MSGDSFNAFRRQYHHSWRDKFEVDNEESEEDNEEEVTSVELTTSQTVPLSPLCADLSSCHEEATGEFNIEDKSINETTTHDIVVKAASFILNLKEK